MEVSSLTEDASTAENKINKAEVAQPHAINDFFEAMHNMHAYQCYVNVLETLSLITNLILLCE